MDRVCLENAILFGFAGVLLIRLYQSIIVECHKCDSWKSKIWLSGLLVGIFLLDNIVSFAIIGSFRKTVARTAEDNTEEITQRVKAVTDELKVGVHEKATTAITVITKLIADARKESTKKIKTMFEKSPLFISPIITSISQLRNQRGFIS